MRFLNFILSFFLICMAVIGDYIVFKSKYSSSQVFRAVTDNLVHASVGFLSSVIFFTHEISITNYACVCNIAFCTFLSSFIDIDHAIAARSIHLSDMTNLKQRGIFHCTSLWLLTSTLLLIYSYLAKKINIFILTIMVIIAYTSHHIRDGNRRGIWLYPFGSTPALPKFLYVSLLVLLPYLLGSFYRNCEPKLYRHSYVTVDYSDKP